MKKYAILFVALIMLMSICVFADTITVTLNGRQIDCEKYGREPLIEDGRTLVPLRSVFEALGADVEWDAKTRTVTSVRDDIEISMTIDSKIMYKNGQSLEIDVPAKILDDRTLVPIRAVAEAFDVEVDWDSKTRTVELFDINTAVFSKGTIDGDTYKNAYLGLKLVLTPDYSFFSNVEIKSVLDYLIEDGEELDLNKEYEKYECIAADKTGNNIQIFAEKITAESDNFDGDSYEKTLSGVVFKCVNLVSGSMPQTVAVAERGDYRMTVVFTYDKYFYLNNMFDMFV